MKRAKSVFYVVHALNEYETAVFYVVHAINEYETAKSVFYVGHAINEYETYVDRMRSPNTIDVSQSIIVISSLVNT
jgi:hypothetical protein